MAMTLCMGCMEIYDASYGICPHCGYAAGTRAKEAYHLAPGTVLHERYVVGRVLGYGGFGVTYIGYDNLMQRKVAIKEYLPGEFATRSSGTAMVTIYTGDKEEQFVSGIRKFSDEARRLAQMERVPGVVRVYDTFSENNTAYIVMEYLDGENLRQRLEREGTIPVEEAVRLILPILHSLTKVHAEGLLHRDISPDNIFLTRTGEVKLLDFGAARYATTTHSRSLSVVVKQGFAPEEQYRSRGDQGTWTDVYACGATLYKMITGVTPEDAMERREKDELLPPSKMGIEIDPNIETAIMNAMNIRIQDRTQTTEEFAAELTAEKKVKRLKSRLKIADIGNWPKWLKITAPTVAAVVIVVAVLLITGVVNNPFVPTENTMEEDQVYVPYVTNMTVENANAKLSEMGLDCQINGKKNDDEIPKGLVLKQEIKAGQVIKKGELVKVTISDGKEKLEIVAKNYEGRSGQEVVDELKKMGFEIEEVSEANEAIAPGSVIRIEYEEGQKEEEGIEKGTKIRVIISKGIEGIDTTKATTVPDLVKVSWEDAAKKAGAAKLYLEQERMEYSDSIPKGQIISQTPAAGTSVNEGTTIRVVVSLGAKTEATVRMPDVTLLSKAEAEQKLTNLGISVSWSYRYDDIVQKDLIIEQSIPENEKVKVGTTVSLVVSKGKQGAVNDDTVIPDEDPSGDTKVTPGDTPDNTKQDTTKKMKEVPDVEGETESSAKSFVERIGLKADVKREFSSSVPEGIAIRTSPVAGTQVENGSTVTIIVSKGPEPVVLQNYTITFDPNGGTVSETKRSVQEGKAIGTLPTPTRDYYTFEGWYDDAYGTGTRYSASSSMDSYDITLYAVWTEHTESDWVPASNVPAGAKITSEKWKYSRKDQMTSKKSSESGWTRTDVITEYGNWSEWTTEVLTRDSSHEVEQTIEEVITGYNMCEYNYADYNGRYYSKYKPNTTQYIHYRTTWITVDELNASTKISPSGWSSGSSSGKNISNETAYVIRGAKQTTGGTEGTSGWVNGDVGMMLFIDSTTKEKVTKYKIREIITTYYYERNVELESSTEVVEGGNISNVRKYVKYITK